MPSSSRGHGQVNAQGAGLPCQAVLPHPPRPAALLLRLTSCSVSCKGPARSRKAMEPHGPPAAQSPAQSHDGQWQGHSSWAVVPPAVPAVRSRCALPSHHMPGGSCTAAAALAGQHVPETAASTAPTAAVPGHYLSPEHRRTWGWQQPVPCLCWLQGTSLPPPGRSGGCQSSPKSPSWPGMVPGPSPGGQPWVQSLQWQDTRRPQRVPGLLCPHPRGLAASGSRVEWDPEKAALGDPVLGCQHGQHVLHGPR